MNFVYLLIPMVLIFGAIILPATYNVIAERHCNEQGMLFVEQNHEFILCKDIDENGNFKYKKFYDIRSKSGYTESQREEHK